MIKINMDTIIQELDTNMNKLNEKIDEIDTDIEKLDTSTNELETINKELNNTIQELDTDIIKKHYNIGDYIRYYKIRNKKTLIVTNGIITKNIEDTLYVVVNIDTNINEKIQVNEIIGKLDELDRISEYINDLIDYPFEDLSIIFLSIFFVFELLAIFMLYLYFNDISLISLFPNSINTIIENTTDQFTNYMNIYLYESKLITV